MNLTSHSFIQATFILCFVLIQTCARANYEHYSGFNMEHLAYHIGQCRGDTQKLSEKVESAAKQALKTELW